MDGLFKRMTENRRDLCSKAAEEVGEVISQHGSKMTQQQYDKVLNLWDRAVVKREDVSADLALLKAELEKSNGGFKKNFPTRPQQPKLNGFQMAAVKAGLDPETPGLERMSFQEMQDLAMQKQRERIEPLRLQCSTFRRGGLATDANGNLIRKR